MTIGKFSVKSVLRLLEQKTQRIEELLAKAEELEAQVNQAVGLLELARHPGQRRLGRCTGKIDCVCWACRVDDYIAQNAKQYDAREDGQDD